MAGHTRSSRFFSISPSSFSREVDVEYCVGVSENTVSVVECG